MGTPLLSRRVPGSPSLGALFRSRVTPAVPRMDRVGRQDEDVRAVVDARRVVRVDEAVQGGAVVGVQILAEHLAGAGEGVGDVGAGTVGNGAGMSRRKVRERVWCRAAVSSAGQSSTTATEPGSSSRMRVKRSASTASMRAWSPGRPMPMSRGRKREDSPPSRRRACRRARAVRRRPRARRPGRRGGGCCGWPTAGRPGSPARPAHRACHRSGWRNGRRRRCVRRGRGPAPAAVRSRRRPRCGRPGRSRRTVRRSHRVRCRRPRSAPVR